MSCCKLNIIHAQRTTPIDEWVELLGDLPFRRPLESHQLCTTFLCTSKTLFSVFV